ncbi:MAG: LacI family DNA-binding transcriptional regulator [Victivallaceae bacterium]|nr:LacI family DNA-binding transcriptional regulator [Victivallaceae bacterium]
MQKRITLEDIARELKISKAAVAKVLLNNRSNVGVSQKRAEEIRAAAKRLNYQPNRLAQSLRSGISHKLALVTGEINSPFFAELARNVQKLAGESGYHLVMFPVEWSHQEEVSAVENAIASNADGLIVLTDLLLDHPELAQSYVERGVRMVALSEKQPGMDSFLYDYYPGVKALFERSGCERIGFLGNERPLAKKENYLRCCEEFGVRPELYHFGSDSEIDDLLTRIIAAKCKRLLVCSDLYAMIAINKLYLRGVRVPDDIAIASIGNVPMGAIYTPPLTAISEQLGTVASWCVNSLISRINGNPDDRHLCVETELIVRKSFPIDL